jgi:hypothetical protein
LPSYDYVSRFVERHSADIAFRTLSQRVEAVYEWPELPVKAKAISDVHGRGDLGVRDRTGHRSIPQINRQRSILIGQVCG